MQNEWRRSRVARCLSPFSEALASAVLDSLAADFAGVGLDLAEVRRAVAEARLVCLSFYALWSLSSSGQSWPAAGCS